MTIRDFEGRRPRIAASAYVDPTALVIGDVEIGEDSSLWPMAVARGDVNAIRIGARSNIQDATVLHVTHDGPYTPGGRALHIAEDVTVGHAAVLHACTVEHTCLIGVRATVMDDAVIEPLTMIAAGSLVPPGKRLDGGALWRGSPARFVRWLSDDEREQLAYSARHYVGVKNRHSPGE